MDVGDDAVEVLSSPANAVDDAVEGLSSESREQFGAPPVASILNELVLGLGLHDLAAARGIPMPASLGGCVSTDWSRGLSTRPFLHDADVTSLPAAQQPMILDEPNDEKP